MNKMNRRIFNFFLLVMFFGIASSVSAQDAPTYRLQRVTSVEHNKKYVFEQAGCVMKNTLSSSKALETTNDFKTFGLESSEGYVWTLESVSGGFKIKRGSSNKLKYDDPTWSFGSTGSTWSFSFQSDGTALIKCSSPSKYMSSVDFAISEYRCYNEGSIYGFYPHSIVIYKLVEETKTSAELHFDNGFVKIEKGDTYEAPVLEKAEGFDGAVTYSSSNKKVATVDASTGVVTIVGTGRALITASSEATEAFDAGEATYTLLVMGGDGTADKPYSVSDMNSGYMKQNTSKYVKGYIVGYYTSESVFTITADDDKCVAIADDRDGITSSDIALIEFNTGDPQTNYGLKSNPAELGKLVRAYGNMNILRKKTCIDNVESLSFADRYPVTISSYKYATYRTTEKLNFTDTGVSAYTAAIDGSNVKLTKIGDGIVDTGLGVVLYGETAGTYDIPVTTDEATVGSTGLSISDGETATKANMTYVLGKKNDVVGFYRWVGSASLPAGRVYLNGDSGGTARDYLEFMFDDDSTTGVDGVVKREEIKDKSYYDLQGRRVAHGQQPVAKGLYVVNGKKVVVK